MGNDQSSASPPPNGRAQQFADTRSASFRVFRDNYNDLETLQSDLRRAGLESCNLILAVDFTASNKWQGKQTNQGRPLHDLNADGRPNPYESAISIISKTLSAFDDDGLIPVYGFGSAETNDNAVFSFMSGEQPLQGLDSVLGRYRQIAPGVKLAGPTSFAPAIRKACQIVQASGGQYHVLVIIADGQVSRPSDLPSHLLSDQERDTIAAIVEACNLPLSIVTIGVGDGPWDVMEEFDDRLPQRAFDNFQFVPLAETLGKAMRKAPVGATPQQMASIMETTFALNALMELPEQYRAITRLGLMGRAAASRVRCQPVPVLPPPAPAYAPVPQPTYPGVAQGVAPGMGPGVMPQGMAGAPPGMMPPGYGVPVGSPMQGPPGYGQPYGSPGQAQPHFGGPPSVPVGHWQCRCGAVNPPNKVTACFSCGQPPLVQSLPPDMRSAAAGGAAAAPSAPAAAAAAGAESSQCPVCLERPRDMAFQCGHLVCRTCGPLLQNCPLCRQAITARIPLFQ